jgi:hypothetical protein
MALKRNRNAGGKSTIRKPKVRNPGGEARARADDPDAVDPSDIDIVKLEFLEIEISPATRARLRARRRHRRA